jgi:tRNA-dihydrouridine synthase 3
VNSGATTTYPCTIRRREEDGAYEGEPPTKKPKLSGAQRKKLAKESKQKQRGQNKARRFLRVADDVDVCWKVACSLPCEGPYVP